MRYTSRGSTPGGTTGSSFYTSWLSLTCPFYVIVICARDHPAAWVEQPAAQPQHKDVDASQLLYGIRCGFARLSFIRHIENGDVKIGMIQLSFQCFGSTANRRNYNVATCKHRPHDFQSKTASSSGNNPHFRVFHIRTFHFISSLELNNTVHDCETV